MRKYFLFFFAFFLLSSCKDEVIQKPDNLIDVKTMESILYDLSLLQAMRANNQGILDSNNINPKTYVYKKYKIDSLQFVKSNQYYASDVKRYKRMYNAINNRLTKDKTTIDSILKIEENKNPDAVKSNKKDSLDQGQVK